MTESATEIAPQPQGAQPTLDEIKDRIDELIGLAPSGGNFLIFSLKHRAARMSTRTLNECSWRIHVEIVIPAKPSFFYAFFAGRGVEGATRSIEFMLAVDEFEDDTANGAANAPSKSRHYIVFNGSYPSSPFRQEEPSPKLFQDEMLAIQFGEIYHTQNFEDALKVIRSEITGEKAFED